MKSVIKTVIITLIYFFFSCDMPNKKKVDVKNDTEDIQVSVNKLKKEILYYDSLLIDKKFPLKTSKANIVKILGQPTIIEKIKSVNWLSEFYLNDIQNIKRYYFGNTIFEGNNDTLLLRQVDFESTDIDLSDSKIILNKRTPFYSLYKVFPESCKIAQIETGNAASGVIAIKAFKLSNGRLWHLHFKRDSLLRVTFFDEFH
ncbi:MAG: hypothetical protein JNL70_10995 [Saprospiraceae bacterium]|nr:hypothetical protein [Saprospiraceae bacterium]